jgi:hypothetical protein
MFAVAHAYFTYNKIKGLEKYQTVIEQSTTVEHVLQAIPVRGTI